MAKSLRHRNGDGWLKSLLKMWWAKVCFSHPTPLTIQEQKPLICPLCTICQKVFSHFFKNLHNMQHAKLHVRTLRGEKHPFPLGPPGQQSKMTISLHTPTPDESSFLCPYSKSIFTLYHLPKFRRLLKCKSLVLRRFV